MPIHWEREAGDHRRRSRVHVGFDAPPPFPGIWRDPALRGHDQTLGQNSSLHRRSSENSAY